jgi:hypothetical protein
LIYWSFYYFTFDTLEAIAFYIAYFSLTIFYNCRTFSLKFSSRYWNYLRIPSSSLRTTSSYFSRASVTSITLRSSASTFARHFSISSCSSLRYFDH